MLLDKVASVEEAVSLLEQYDMHASMGYMMHLALADITGRRVVVEYVDNEMVVIETPVATNFYLAEGEKNGIGTAQSHTRYEILASLNLPSGALCLSKAQAKPTTSIGRIMRTDIHSSWNRGV